MIRKRNSSAVENGEQPALAYCPQRGAVALRQFGVSTVF